MDQDHSKPEISNGRLEMWKLEQEVVSSLVEVDADPTINPSIVPDNPLFFVVPDDHQDFYSFSSSPELYGGVDVSFPEKEGDDAVAVYVIIDKRNMKRVYEDHEYFALEIPYVPTFLAFREIEPLQRLVHKQVQHHPDLTPKAILVDGNGILHPRHAGIACFLGTRTNIPTIGIGKSLLYEGGWTRENIAIAMDQFLLNIHDAIKQNQDSLSSRLSHVRGTIVLKNPPNPSDQKLRTPSAEGSSAESTIDRKDLLQQLAPLCNGIAIPLKGDGDQRFPVLGAALVGHGGHSSSNSDNTKKGTIKPIYVSVGHRLSLLSAVQITASLSLHRIPEPVRVADLYGRELLRDKERGAVASPENSNNTITQGYSEV
eukprot:scaffold1356_cov123-Cylindrotheca_fusiformis.AAC.26